MLGRLMFDRSGDLCAKAAEVVMGSEETYLKLSEESRRITVCFNTSVQHDSKNSAPFEVSVIMN